MPKPSTKPVPQQVRLSNEEIHLAANQMCAFLMDLKISGSQATICAMDALAQTLSAAPPADYARIRDVTVKSLIEASDAYHKERLAEAALRAPRVTLD